MFKKIKKIINWFWKEEKDIPYPRMITKFCGCKSTKKPVYEKLDPRYCPHWLCPDCREVINSMSDLRFGIPPYSTTADFIRAKVREEI